jgi:hypothetical protein
MFRYRSAPCLLLTANCLHVTSTKVKAFPQCRFPPSRAAKLSSPPKLQAQLQLPPKVPPNVADPKSSSAPLRCLKVPVRLAPSI